MLRNCCSLLLCSALLFFSCGQSGKRDAADIIKGHWLILYPDHQLKTRSERDVYGKYQDSIVNLFGLKLLQFRESGEFIEVDSFFIRPSKWEIAGKKTLQIHEGGKGFNPFISDFEGFEKDTLRLLQYLSLEEEKVKVVWHLKRLDEDTAAMKLFTQEANAWRKKPSSPESDEEIRKRLVSLLEFYSGYLKLVGKELFIFQFPACICRFVITSMPLACGRRCRLASFIYFTTARMQKKPLIC